jgi:hypothetical protein
MTVRLSIFAAVLVLAGCAHQQTRLQKPDDEKEKEIPIKTIGDLTTYGNAEPVAVSGVGLVVGLEGTGGDPPAGGFRRMLEDDLRKRGVEHVKEVLASPDVSLVLVSGLIPAGAHVGDPFDVEITLPPQSKTTSLRGGYLKECALYSYENTKHLDPNFQGADRLLLGHQLGKAEGAVVVGVGKGDDASKLRQARIWGGGKSKIERPFYLVMNSDQQRAAVVQRIANRINETFHGPYRGTLGDIAVAKTTSYLVLRVPEQYKLNLGRYLRVVRLIPFQEAAQRDSPYFRRLQEQLLDPAHTVTAALRLEALGSDSIPILKFGLENSHALVRFTSAEALAYLDCPAAGEELAALVERQPLLRAYCLTALASLDEAVSHVKLRELMAAPAPETRYGAFRALHTLDERDAAVQGELLNNSFWIHQVATDSAPLVHLSSSRRAEVVLFGEQPGLAPPFYFLTGEFTVTAAVNDQVCTISRISARHGTCRRQCPLHLNAVLHCLGDMGALYPEIVELLRQAGSYQCLNCPLAEDALPQAVSVYDLARNGANNPEFQQTDDEIMKARDDFGATPTLYQKSDLPSKNMTSEPADESAAEPALKSSSRR